MGDISNMQSKGQQAIRKAREEVEAEDLKTSTGKLKKKLRELQEAETIVGNIKREIDDLEEEITQGNA